MIRVGIGGWTFEPWRGVFYPPELKHADELRYASRQVTSIEINGTFYRTQAPASFRKWAAETPDDFVFSLKGSRYVTNRKTLAEAGPSLARFIESGVSELGRKLGPILWQFAPTKRFEVEDFGAFLELLPREVDGVALRHAVEVRHDSFRTPAFIELLRRFRVPVVYADHPEYPEIADLTGDFVYARLQRSAEEKQNGYEAADIAAWAERCRIWAKGGAPDDLPKLAPHAAPKKPRECFVYFIGSAKVRNPAAAMALVADLAEPARVAGRGRAAKSH
jgi:uncharacterized protein YecE (DUF72 family)